jgi:Ca-activated chloride channel family protein
VIRWGNPHLWWVLAAPLLAAALWVYGAAARRRKLARVGNKALVEQLTATVSAPRRLLKQLVTGLAVLLATLALLRPQFGTRPQPLRQTGIDIAIAFDISKSMLARDVQPSRLDAARGQLAELLKTLHGDRIALVPFAGVAFTQSPLTADGSAIRLYLDSLDPKMMPVGGTNLAMAINEGVRLLTSRGDKAEHRGRSRVLLLITDGEDVETDQGEAARKAAQEAAKQGIHLYAVGVGTRLGEPIPIFDEQGHHAGYQKDSQGKPIYSKLNTALLEELGRLADPEHPDATHVFPFDGTDPVAPKLAEQLDGLQKTTLEQMIRHAHGEKFQYALLPAVLLLLLDLWVGERRKRVVADAAPVMPRPKARKKEAADA